MLPELLTLRGIDQSIYHHADVYEHTLDVLHHTAALERAPAVLGDQTHAALEAQLADGLTHWHSMRFAALLHDIAKPQTRSERPDGRGASFLGHDSEGAEVARTILRRLRAAERVVEHVAALTLHLSLIHI